MANQKPSALARARVTYTWGNGNQVVVHHDWEDEYDREADCADPDGDRGYVCGLLESAAQSDFHPMKDMNLVTTARLTRVKVERVDG